MQIKGYICQAHNWQIMDGTPYASCQQYASKDLLEEDEVEVEVGQGNNNVEQNIC